MQNFSLKYARYWCCAKHYSYSQNTSYAQNTSYVHTRSDRQISRFAKHGEKHSEKRGAKHAEKHGKMLTSQCLNKGLVCLVNLVDKTALNTISSVAFLMLLSTLSATSAAANSSLNSVGNSLSPRADAFAMQQNDDLQIDPNIERRDIDEFDIDSENIEIGIYAGIISIEDFSSDVTLGARLTYHVNENLFVEANYAQATAGQTSFEVLSGGVAFLTEEQREYTYYDLSAAYNFNGELFLTDSLVFNTDFFVIIGAGSTDFGGDERFTFNAGVGYRLLVTDYLSVRFDVRDYVFNSDIIGPEKNVHNLTFTLSTSFFF